jgi:mannose-6-phosphate isomerase-like protein (cupin superfamily)
MARTKTPAIGYSYCGNKFTEKHKMVDISLNHFTDESQAMREIEAAGYHPITLDFPKLENENHWHEFDSYVYVLEGEITITDADTGETCDCPAGTRIVAPRGVLHREVSNGYKALIGLSVKPEELTQPIDKPPPVVPA